MNGQDEDGRQPPARTSTEPAAGEPSAAAGESEGELDFERALEELEAVVERMESGELSLDASLAAFERGIRLTRRCQQALAAAEQRVQVLIERDDGTLESGSFERPEDSDA